MLLAIEADRMVDARGLMCPMPILKLAKEFKDLQEDQIVKLLTTDPGSLQDVPAWADDTDNEVVGQSEENGVYTFFIKKLPEYH